MRMSQSNLSYGRQITRWPLNAVIFAIVDEPYCLWEGSVRERNSQFLAGLDPDYFDFVLKTFSDAEDEARAIVALQMGLHHATEVMFSLLGALVQAPFCAYAWVGKCSNSDLREFVKRVNRGEELLNPIVGLHRVTWEAIAGLVMRSYRTNTSRQAQIIQGFADFWRQTARTLTDPSEVEQYNALKHGFRVRTGGFKMSMALEDPLMGKPGPAIDMGGSDYGASFFALERISGREKHQIQSKSTSINWVVDRMILQYQLVAMSIRNTVSALLVVNGKQPSTCKFVCPEEVDDFARPWRVSSGVTTARFDLDLDATSVPALSRDELLAQLRTLHTTPVPPSSDPHGTSRPA